MRYFGWVCGGIKDALIHGFSSTLLKGASQRFAARPVCSSQGTGAGAGVDSVREQEKLEARKMLENSYSPQRPVRALLGGVY